MVFPLNIFAPNGINLKGDLGVTGNWSRVRTWNIYGRGCVYVELKGYWLYAAVSSKCLMVTNDEMRDHLFQLLGNSFFPRWKERHQVRLTVSRSGIGLSMPPPYSIVIQESEEVNWHIPTVTGDDLETPREWLCATRRNIMSCSIIPKSPLSNVFAAGSS